ncbi:hypothetical protein [Zunongwangia endophytica]|uniref:LPXTG cell wall anchor domain-containing protein n=1 Tax=Zunongwangia endophytica TaxID=1808945 RepID=A0ABV8H444_9FLAO|nr:hypothetical protein [Zunongwangia endophytica]MDN3594469.1 hypothetical protein [Zunongwangia endophytica]
MNKVRIVGIIFVILGLLLAYYWRNTEVYFFVGILLGIGLLWSITGRTKRKKKTD